MTAPAPEVLLLRIQLITASRSHRAALKAFERCPSKEMDTLVEETRERRDALLEQWPHP